MKKTGFTLLELLIVITIIAILAGAVLPYVQQYIDDTRFSKAKQDLSEIRNALVRYETDQSRLYEHTDLRALIGPYLNKGMSDPWGSPYLIAPASSTCYSLGPDRTAETGDEIRQNFRPPLALARAAWEDANNNTRVDSGDVLVLKFTRPLRDQPGDGPQTAIANDDFVYSNGAPDLDYSTPMFFNNRMTVRIPINYSAPGNAFKPGLDTLSIVSGNTLYDGENTPCIIEMPVAIKAQ